MAHNVVRTTDRPRGYRPAVQYRLNPVEWEMVYPVHVDPIGRVRLEDGRYAATLGEEALGAFDTGDEAAEAIWERFVESSYVRHDEASRLHGGRERHR